MECSICCKTFTKMMRKQIECFHCHTLTCFSCVKKNILESSTEAKCYHCNIEWDRNFMVHNLSKNFYNIDYRNHCSDIISNSVQSFVWRIKRIIEYEKHKKDYEESMLWVKLLIKDLIYEINTDPNKEERKRLREMKKEKIDLFWETRSNYISEILSVVVLNTGNFVFHEKGFKKLKDFSSNHNGLPDGEEHSIHNSEDLNLPSMVEIRKLILKIPSRNSKGRIVFNNQNIIIFYRKLNHLKLVKIPQLEGTFCIEFSFRKCSPEQIYRLKSLPVLKKYIQNGNKKVLERFDYQYSCKMEIVHILKKYLQEQISNFNHLLQNENIEDFTELYHQTKINCINTITTFEKEYNRSYKRIIHLL